MSCLEKTEYVESLRKGTSPGSRYFAMPGKVVGRATTSVKLCQWENRIHAIEQEKKRRLHTQKVRIHIQIRSVDLQWSYISCNRRCTNFVFRRIIYLLEQRSNIWPGESKSALISLSAGLPKMSGWTPSLVSHPFPLTNGSDLSLRALPEGKPWVSQSKKSSNLFQSEM